MASIAGIASRALREPRVSLAATDDLLTETCTFKVACNLRSASAAAPALTHTLLTLSLSPLTCSSVCMVCGRLYLAASFLNLALCMANVFGLVASGLRLVATPIQHYLHHFPGTQSQHRSRDFPFFPFSHVPLLVFGFCRLTHRRTLLAAQVPNPSPSRNLEPATARRALHAARTHPTPTYTRTPAGKRPSDAAQCAGWPFTEANRTGIT